MQEKNSNPAIEFCSAKFDNCLSNTEVPEIIVLPIVAGSPPYLSWIYDMTQTNIYHSE